MNPMLSDIVSAALQLISIIAWPVLILVLAYWFRSQLAEVLRKLSQLSVGSVKFTFAEIANSLDKQLEATPKTDELDTSLLLIQEKLFDLAAVSPRAAVFEAWLRVEDAATDFALKSVAWKTGSIFPRASHVSSVARLVLEEHENRLLNDLRFVRNRAAHDLDFHLDAKEARQFINKALRIASRLSNVN